MDYLPELIPILTTLICVATAADLCPYRVHSDDIFAGSINFKYCRRGCCGHDGHNVCCSGPPIDLVIGCAAGAAVIIIAVVVITCCFCARSRGTTRRVVRTTIMAPTIFHTDSTNLALSPDAGEIFQPPPYDVITSGHDKPPSYDEVMRSTQEHQSSAEHGK